MRQYLILLTLLLGLSLSAFAQAQSKSSCPSLEEVNKLASKAKLPKIFHSKYNEAIIGYFCDDAIERIDHFVDVGYADQKEVLIISKVLGKIYKPKIRTNRGIKFESSEYSFLRLGLCAACASNVAHFLVDYPNSRCGKLAKQALDGIPDAIEEITEYPDYCNFVKVEDSLNQEGKRSTNKSSTSTLEVKENDKKQSSEKAINEERRRLDADRKALEQDRQRFTEERNRREQAKQSSKLALQTTTTNPDANGVVIISVRTNADTSSLKVNGNEEGSKVDGNYTIKRVARVSQDTNYTIVATDVFGHTASTTITVARQAVSQSSNQSASLKPESIKRAASRDAVAIIIGIQNYKRVPKAEFANSDAKDFYEYAIRGLGIKPENIKLLLDEDAEQVELYKAFQNWLPLQVTKDKTDVYVFYSGHGLPSPDGKSLYILPQGVDKQFIEKTAVSQQEVIAALVASKPKSVTMFIDACYSGQTRSGEMMIASVRPLAVKSETSVYPPNFTVISASSNDQYSSSSPELKHGIFSFYLMKGMEGEADGNKDGKITAGEMQEYLSDKVSRQAMSMSRKQDTQLVGDANRVLMGR